MAQKFDLEEQGKIFNFELDDKGVIWLFENGLDKPKVNLGQTGITPNIGLEKAKELAREMLLSFGYIEKK